MKSIQWLKLLGHLIKFIIRNSYEYVQYRINGGDKHFYIVSKTMNEQTIFIHYKTYKQMGQYVNGYYKAHRGGKGHVQYKVID